MSGTHHIQLMHDLNLRTVTLISQKLTVQKQHVHPQTAAAAAAAATATAYSRPGSTNHGIFLITLCFADSIKEPYDSPTHHHGSNLQTVRSQTLAVHACHHLSGMRWMHNTRGIRSC